MNEKINSFSKEAIKVRMLQNAVKIWGLKSVSSVDPFVSLLIDAFSTEIFKANNQIQSANSRTLEKLAKLLTPSIYTYPQPAHAIAYSYPNETIDVLPSDLEFFTQKPMPSAVKSVSDSQIEVHFTAVDDIQLLKMNTELLITSNTCYRFDEDQNKIPIARINTQTIKHNRIYLAINATDFKEVNFPKKLALYCSNPTFEYVDFVFKLLPFINVTNGEKKLRVKSGLSYEVKKNSSSGYEEIFNEFAMRKQIEVNIKNIYKEKFIELYGLNQDAITDSIPENLAFIKNQPEIFSVIADKKMIWLEIEFPPQYSHNILENFSFTLNAFPIYNRKWSQNEYALNVMGDNVPLATTLGEHFLYVEKVEDSSGNQYKEIPFKKDSNLNGKGLYTIRKGGMERFSDRDAVEMILNVLELTRDEVTAFGVLDRDRVVEALQIMTSQMRVLEQKVSNAERSLIQEINYVIVNPYDDVTNLKASYWITHCSFANSIRSGLIMSQPKVTGVNNSQKIKLLTSTIGGGEEQKGTNAIQAYKYALTTRDKLISIEDIKNFCYLMLDSDVRSVEVSRGTIISSKPKEGFVKTIEVEIIPNVYQHLGKLYWDNLSENLKQQIMLRGIDGIEYIVTIKNCDDE